jgi:HSP20 family protein
MTEHDSSKKPKRPEGFEVQEEMDQLFTQFRNLWASPLLSVNRIWRPPTDVLEYPDHIIVRTEIAGMEKDKISIRVKNNVLMIRGTRQKELEHDECVYRNMELTYGRFERNILLPDSADPDQISANYKDGFLILTVQKRDVAGTAREIEISED